MSEKPLLFIWIGLVILVVACSQTQPTPVILPTGRLVPATPASGSAPATSSPAADTPLIVSPTAGSLPVEPTRSDSLQPQDEAFLPIIGLEPFMTGFEDPVYLTYASEAPPWASRLFVVEKTGRIQVVENGQVQPAPFLDIVDRVGSKGNEQGLLSVAFPPNFDTSEVFYVDYTDLRGNTVVARYELMGRDPPQGDPNSEQKLLGIVQPASNHNGGQLQFGPDGYLYIGTGDGGRAGDPWGNAQNPGVLLGKMLRIDVGGSDTYRIPSNNRFLDWPDARSEIWALGLRNPWRFSFDRATGDLYIADVGQNTYEEVNFQPAQSTGGENYGWNIMEGGHCFAPARECDSTGLILPVAEYDHKLGCSVTGGYVYRGGRYPKMTGVYFFGDFCSGLIWGLRRRASGEWDMALLLESDVAISSFGQDGAGELYVLDYNDGTIYRLIAAP
jgi:glucose/arabinose dehydrogenase